jgi:hypothetical protein
MKTPARRTTSGAASVSGSSFTSNSAAFGGGIYNLGTLNDDGTNTFNNNSPDDVGR